jgi:hypothetical protein
MLRTLTHRAPLLALVLGTALLGVACGSDDAAPGAAGPAPTQAFFDFSADLTAPEHFYDLPYPSDLRLDDAGHPDLRGFPNPKNVALVSGLVNVASQHPGFPVLPVAYFRFTKPVAVPANDATVPLAPDVGSSFLLLDVDPSSPARGTLFPLMAQTWEPDPYLPENVVAVAPVPGFVLSPNRQYAFVVKTSLVDADGKTVGQPAAMAALAAGNDPGGALGPAAVTLYAPLFETLGILGVPSAEVAAATVFTTGDIVADTFAVSEKVKAAHSVTLEDLALDPDDGASHPEFCELHGKVVYPQFQRGTPPFDTEGLFELGPDGTPVKQRDEEAPISLMIPKMAMPDGGFPLVVYFHGSGGTTASVMDPSLVDQPEKGKGPAAPITARGFAMVSSALPVNPERLPGAGDTEYLNVNNMAALRDTFRQGVVEQRLFMEALRTVTIDPALLAACVGPTLPAGETAFHFAEDDLFAMGQSMGGMYTNMIGAVEPRIRAVVPTGAGGFWTYFIFETELIGNLGGIFKVLLQTQNELSFLHPVFAIGETGLDAADPFVYMPRLARDPLPGHPVRPIYEPVAPGDSYFPTTIYDAVVLSYEHPQAGSLVWSSMQDSLAQKGLDGLLPYPVADNRKGPGDAPYTGVVVQYEGTPGYDPHSIYATRDEVKYQYGCFFQSFLETGVATVFEPGPLDSPCP